MSEDLDELLAQFIYAANECVEDGKFVRSERYLSACAAIRRLSESDKLACYGRLERLKIGCEFEKNRNLCDLFKAEFYF